MVPGDLGASRRGCSSLEAGRPGETWEGSHGTPGPPAPLAASRVWDEASRGAGQAPGGRGRTEGTGSGPVVRGAPLLGRRGGRSRDRGRGGGREGRRRVTWRRRQDPNTGGP